MGSPDYYGVLLAYGEFVSDVDVCGRVSPEDVCVGLSGASVDFGGSSFAAFLEAAAKSGSAFEVSIFWRGRIWRCDVAPALSFDPVWFSELRPWYDAARWSDKGTAVV